MNYFFQKPKHVQQNNRILFVQGSFLVVNFSNKASIELEWTAWFDVVAAGPSHVASPVLAVVFADSGVAAASSAQMPADS